MSQERDGWIGRSLGGRQIVIILASSAIAIAVSTSLQPILLDGLLSERRLTIDQLGQTATSELVAMALVCSIAGAFFSPDQLRLKAAIAGLAVVVANLLTMAASSERVLLARALSGAGYGVYMWILACLLVRSHNAARYTGIFVAAQAIISVVLSYVLTAAGASRFGINGGYVCLALISAVTVMASGLFPTDFDPLPVRSSARLPPRRGFAGLVAIFLYLAGVMGIWVFVGAMSRASGHTPQQTQIALSIALAAQFFGAILAASLGNRLKPTIAIGIGGVCSFALAATFTANLNIALFTICGALFGLLWMFSTPFLMPFIMEADSTRTTAMYSLTVQMLGSASGPALSGLLVRGTDVRWAIFGSGIMLVAAVAVAILSQSSAGRIAMARSREQI